MTFQTYFNQVARTPQTYYGLVKFGTGLASFLTSSSASEQAGLGAYLCMSGLVELGLSLFVFHYEKTVFPQVAGNTPLEVSIANLMSQRYLKTGFFRYD